MVAMTERKTLMNPAVEQEMNVASFLMEVPDHAPGTEVESPKFPREGKEYKPGTDGFSEYLKAIGEWKILSREQEREVAGEIERAMGEVNEALFHSRRARAALAHLLVEAAREGKFDGQLIEKGKKGRTHLSKKRLQHLIRILTKGPRHHRLRNPLEPFRVSLELLQKVMVLTRRMGPLRGDEREEMKQLDLARDRLVGRINRLVQSNLKLVVSIAKNYYAPSMTMLDLIQEGNLGLLKAAERFDYRRGYKFSTYATWWVKQAITRARMTQARLIRLPVHLEDKLSHFKKLYRLQNQFSEGTSPMERIARKLKTPVREIQRLVDVDHEPMSLQAPMGDNEFQYLLADETAAKPEERAETSLLKKDLAAALTLLNEKEGKVLRLRYGLEDGIPKTLEEVGHRFRLTRERIRQIEIRALGKLARTKRLEWLKEYLAS